MRKELGFTAVELVVAMVCIFGATGWVWNIAKIAGSNFSEITGMLVLRVVGIFIAPLGCILGYF